MRGRRCTSVVPSVDGMDVNEIDLAVQVARVLAFRAQRRTEQDEA